MLIQINTWSDGNNHSNTELEIFGYGITEHRKSVLIKIKGYEYYYYVRVPDEFTIDDAHELIKTVTVKANTRRRNKFGASAVPRCELIQGKTFRGFNGDKRHKFIKIYFNSYGYSRVYDTALTEYMENTYGPDNYYLHNNMIDPTLLLFHEYNIKPVGIIEVKDELLKPAGKYYNATSDAYEVHINDITPRHDITSMYPIKIMAYDIECIGNDDGMFPNASDESNMITQIGCTFNYLGSIECYRKVMFTYNTCDDIEGVEVRCFKKEADLLKAWRALIIQECPDILTGWNIFGFDNKYIDKRAEVTGCSSIVTKLGKLSQSIHCELKDKRISSAALGVNLMHYFDMHGRVTFDLMKEVQKSYNLSSYKLDNAAAHFIRGKVIKISDNGYTVYTDDITTLHNNQFILFTWVDEFVDMFTENKYFIDNIDVDNKVLTLREPLKLTTSSQVYWTQVKDNISYTNIREYQFKDSKHRAEIAKYCIQDCVLCNVLTERLKVVVNAIAMANTCHVPISYLFLRGQTIKGLSLLTKECSDMGYYIPCLTANNHKVNDQGYKGAVVFEPKPNIYRSPISVLDYASLYPRSIISYNISPETCVIDTLQQEQADKSTYDFKTVNILGDDDEVLYTVTYAKHKDRVGIVPHILLELLRKRKEMKKLMASEEDPHMKSIYDGQQLAYKLTANSIYGLFGTTFGHIQFVEIAASTTMVGRKMLMFARTYVEEQFYAEVNANIDKLTTSEVAPLINNNKIKITPDVIYGDTDSIFIDWNMDTSHIANIDKTSLIKLSINLGVLAAKYIKPKLIAPHDLEYEKTFYPLILLSKKRYTANKYEFDPTKYTHINQGTVIIRRDNAPVTKTVVNSIVNAIINKMSSNEEIIEEVNQILYKIINREYNIGSYIISKTLKDTYHNRKGHPHVVLADRMRERDPGTAPLLNERVEYIYIKDKDTCINDKSGNHVEHPDYIKKNKLVIDVNFYIHNQIKQSIKPYLTLIMSDEEIEDIFNEWVEYEENRFVKTQLAHRILTNKKLTFVYGEHNHLNAKNISIHMT